MGEEPIYDDGQVVRISKQRAVFGGNTYAMSQVSAVSLQTVPPSRGGAVTMIVVGSLLMLLGGGMGLAESVFGGVVFGGSGVALLIAGIVMYEQAKPSYVIVLSTSGGQVQALAAPTLPQLQPVHDALQEALIQRG